MGRLITKVSFNDHTHWVQLAGLADFRSQRLAKLIGLSRRQVERYIKRHFGLTLQEWLRELRMTRAVELIREMHSVKEVAYSLGFSQVSSFCRQFKAHHGVTCSEYAADIAHRRINRVSHDSRVAHFSADPPPRPLVSPHSHDNIAVG